MTSTRLRSGAARLGLLVAMVHFLAMAALPFTHSHALSGAADEVLTGPLETDGGRQSGHTDLCAICRTLANAQMEPAFATAFATPSEFVVVSRSDDKTVAHPQIFTISQPRAPPLA